MVLLLCPLLRGQTLLHPLCQALLGSTTDPGALYYFFLVFITEFLEDSKESSNFSLSEDEAIFSPFE